MRTTKRDKLDPLIIPPTGTVGVWVDIRPLANYPRMAHARGELRAAQVCRHAILAWHSELVSDYSLTAIGAKVRQLAAEAAPGLELLQLPAVPAPELLAPAPAPAEPAVPQDDFMAALATVFG